MKCGRRPFFCLPICVPLLIARFLAVSATAAEEVESTAGRSGESAYATELMEVFQLVLDHHVDPPTLQQMVYECITTEAVRRDHAPPAGLVQDVSRASQAELRSLLAQSFQVADRPPLTVALASLKHQQVVLETAEEHRVNEQLAANRYVGLGIQTSRQGKIPMVFKVAPGGTAEQAGFQDGDLIVEVDGKSTDGVDMGTLVQWLRGAEGTSVDVTLERDGKRHAYHVVRRTVPFATLRLVGKSSSGKTALIRLHRLSASTVHELRKIRADLKDTVENVAIDLRGCAGQEHHHYGALLASALVDGGPLGAIVTRHRRREIEADPGTLFPGRKVAVVVGTNTAGAVLWLGRVMSDSGQCVVLGQVNRQHGILVSEDFPLESKAWVVRMPVGSLVSADSSAKPGQVVAGGRLSHPTVNSFSPFSLPGRTPATIVQPSSTVRSPIGLIEAARSPAMPRIADQLEAELEAAGDR